MQELTGLQGHGLPKTITSAKMILGSGPGARRRWELTPEMTSGVWLPDAKEQEKIPSGLPLGSEKEETCCIYWAGELQNTGWLVTNMAGHKYGNYGIDLIMSKAFCREMDTVLVESGERKLTPREGCQDFKPWLYEDGICSLCFQNRACISKKPNSSERVGWWGLKNNRLQIQAGTEDFSCLIGSYSNNNNNVLSLLLAKLPVSWCFRKMRHLPIIYKHKKAPQMNFQQQFMKVPRT